MAEPHGDSPSCRPAVDKGHLDAEIPPGSAVGWSPLSACLKEASTLGLVGLILLNYHVSFIYLLCACVGACLPCMVQVEPQPGNV